MFFPPPPPAPPPPPPPNQTIRGLPAILDDAGILFTAARASLNHQPMPREKPINPPHISRRQGQPTVGVTPDKMAAFLHEMKSVRLRKTGQDLDLSGSFSSGSSRALSTGSNSFSKTSKSDERSRVDADVSFLSRSMIAPRPFRPAAPPPPTIPRVGDKRKRKDTLGAISQVTHDARNKRALLPAMQLTQTQAQSSSSGSSTSPVGLFSESSGSSTEPVTSDQGTSTVIWPTQPTVPDAPTPSLCSDDNDPEKEDEHDQPPSTPPQILPSRSMYRFRGTGIPVTPSEGSRSSILNKSLLLQAQQQEREHEQDPAQAQETPQHSSQHIDYEDSFIPIHPITPNDPTVQPESTVFEKRRLPVSPLPAKSPRKPHPPNRRRSTPHPRKLSLPPDDHEDEEPPPVLTFSTPPVAISTPGPTATQAPPKPVADTPDIFNDSRVARSRPPPSRIPVPSSRLRSSSLKSSSAPQAPSGRWVTLGEELWHAQQSDEINGENDDELDVDVYVGTGMRSRDRSFLAHGGAGGPPVLMGVGYVEGAEDREGSPDPYLDS
ncbi:hypothetical protein P691DRAFT_233327 [Macrolepiota fuliginosa MF-IS2]|uniref:Uncharacterized protein n=1 Tax=Macrolepiota fuliginosa MF-IS2 TaxID=1400762 RepID=A0A9P6C7W9_9AGAR|nr:hypothetical protein P691DRAFT_233327 [Macrolepiota fuliginosa MF-IS2]